VNRASRLPPFFLSFCELAALLYIPSPRSLLLSFLVPFPFLFCAFIFAVSDQPGVLACVPSISSTQDSKCLCITRRLGIRTLPRLPFTHLRAAVRSAACCGLSHGRWRCFIHGGYSGSSHSGAHRDRSRHPAAIFVFRLAAMMPPYLSFVDLYYALFARTISQTGSEGHLVPSALAAVFISVVGRRRRLEEQQICARRAKRCS